MGWLIEFNRRYQVTGGQWFLFFAAMVAVWVGVQADGGFSFWAAFIVFGFFWLISAPFRAINWVNRRLNSRPCPVCGIRVPNGETQCAGCRTDFRIR
jgi:predicted nucleic acid-binding Zn ribbon protein